MTSSMTASQQRTFAVGILSSMRPAGVAGEAQIAYLMAQMQQENTGASNNPLATTQQYAGSTSFNQVANTKGVQNYASAQIGEQASAITLQNGKYSTLTEFLQGKIPITQVNTSELATWSGSSTYASKVLDIAASKVSDSALSGQFKAAAAAATTSASTSSSSGSSNTAYTPTSPADSAATARTKVSQDNDGTSYSQDNVIWDGLDNTPWWKLEGALVGNPNLRRVPDAIQFMLALPPTDTGNYLTTTDGGTDKVIIRLNVGLSSLGQGSAHQNGVEPTATGILVNLWDSRPDMLSGSGTTGTFMNLGGITSLMSCQQSPASSSFLSVLTKTFSHLNASKNGLRVAAQDAFMELWALFKNNGLIRYTGDSSNASLVLSSANELMVNNLTGLSGYQMRHRVGDVMDAGYVVMLYKDRTLMGRFKTFDLTANADSPYRWDFSFTFRVLSDFVPYNVNGT